ncbi:MAG TPA: cellulase family glycosylhydrolase [bacterium]|nr:cellulase family glycosylhydrolase [bacterium]HQP97629.1 cellulase family glycosylhydrolase [bacterium]
MDTKKYFILWMVFIPLLGMSCHSPSHQVSESTEITQAPPAGTLELLNLPPSKPVPFEPLPPVWGGANQAQLWFQPDHRRQRQLVAVQNAGLRMLRIILGHREESVWWDDPPDPYTFESPIGFFHEDSFNRVDRFITECRQAGIRLIVTFGIPTNYFAEFGDWDFYTSTAAKRAYLNRIRQCLLHVHQPSGAMWRDLDDVIWAWEIANEPGINLKGKNSHSPEETVATIHSWLTMCAATIAALDPDTLISIGTAGHSRYYGVNTGDDLRDLGDIPHADIYTLHFYGGDLKQWIRDAKTVTVPFHKQLFIEEFGVQRKARFNGQIETYRYVTEICNRARVPWMFWNLGHLKEDSAWCISEDDPVWNDVVVPAAQEDSGL